MKILIIISLIIILILILKYDKTPNHIPSWYEINNHYIRKKGE